MALRVLVGLTEHRIMSDENTHSDSDGTAPIVDIAAEFDLTVSGRLPDLIVAAVTATLVTDLLVQPFLEQVALITLVVTFTTV